MIVHEGVINLVGQELGYRGMTRQGSRRLSRPTTISKVAGVADFRILTNREGTTGFRTSAGMNVMGSISSRSDCEATWGARSFRKDAGIYLMRLHESTRVAIDQTNNTIAISCVYGGRP